jgi:hypothetical protein
LGFELVVLLNTPYLKLQRPTAEIANWKLNYAVLTEKSNWMTLEAIEERG